MSQGTKQEKMKRDLRIGLCNLKRFLSNLNNSVMNEMVDFGVWDLLSKFICSEESCHSDHVCYTDLCVPFPLNQLFSRKKDGSPFRKV